MAALDTGRSHASSTVGVTDGWSHKPSRLCVLVVFVSEVIFLSTVSNAEVGIIEWGQVMGGIEGGGELFTGMIQRGDLASRHTAPG